MARSAVGAALIAAAVLLPLRDAAAQGARFATFNASLNRGAAGQLVTDLSTPNNAQAKTVAEIIQRVAPDVLLINEFDYVAGGTAVNLFQQNYLAVGQNVSGVGPAAPIRYGYSFVAPSNTGIPTGFDLNNNGVIGGGDDAQGFGAFEGQFGMALYSKYPILTHQVRTFQNFLWKDMPGALLPDDPNTPAPNDWYSPAEQAILRLSSKSHWDIPIDVNGTIIHVLASHPTPPVFDGPEDRNGKRNHDEIRLWADYITPGKGSYIYDDKGVFGGLADGSLFMILGDQNADPFDGDSFDNAILQLLNHPGVNTTNTPFSLGGPEQALLDGGANLRHRGDPAFDTADFFDGAAGNLRADYALPSTGLQITDSGVFWPLRSDPLYALVGDRQGAATTPSSDHSLVFVNVQAIPEPTTLALFSLGGLALIGSVRRRRNL